MAAAQRPRAWDDLLDSRVTPQSVLRCRVNGTPTDIILDCVGALRAALSCARATSRSALTPLIRASLDYLQIVLGCTASPCSPAQKEIRWRLRRPRTPTNTQVINRIWYSPSLPGAGDGDYCWRRGAVAPRGHPAAAPDARFLAPRLAGEGQGVRRAQKEDLDLTGHA